VKQEKWNCRRKKSTPPPAVLGFIYNGTATVAGLGAS